MKKLILLLLTLFLVSCNMGDIATMEEAREILTENGFEVEDITTEVNQEGVKEALLAMKGSDIIIQYYDTTDPNQARSIYDALKSSVDYDIDREDADILSADNTLRIIRNNDIFLHLEERDGKVFYAFCSPDVEVELQRIIRAFGF